MDEMTSIEEFSAFKNENRSLLGEVADAWRLYVGPHDNGMPCSLEYVIFAFHIMKKIKPESVLDAGVGITTLLFRRFKEYLGYKEIHSVDPSQAWLDKIGSMLESGNHFSGNMGDFRSLKGRTFDFISYDYGTIEMRYRLIDSHLGGLIKANSVILIDDYHKSGYPEAIGRFITKNGLESTDIRAHTLDGFGRYATLAVKR